jgi:N-acetylglucosaminyldiphosphoundecaprenol N-acetyl-beta-D-mannosaminyltransferase
MNTDFEPILILGVRVDLISLDELLRQVLLVIQNREKATIAYVNVHAVNLAQNLIWLKAFFKQARVVFCDGFGVKWAARFLAGKELQRFTPPDWFGRLAELCASEGFSLFFLGTRQEIIGKAAAVLKEKYPKLKIVGIHHGFFDKTVHGAENRMVIAKINALEPDILVVGFGMPAQEKWILENLDDLNVRVVLTVGAFFDYLAGDVVRAPHWMTDHGLEWLGRLLIEPRRLWKRYILGNPCFLWRVLMQKLGIVNYDLPPP